MRYRLYQYVIAINHFKDEMYLCENVINDLNSEIEVIESLITSKNVPVYPFKIKSGRNSKHDMMMIIKKWLKKELAVVIAEMFFRLF